MAPETCAWEPIPVHSLFHLVVRFALVTAWLQPTAGSAEPRCFEAIKAMNFAMQELPELDVFALTLKNDGESRQILFFSLDEFLEEAGGIRGGWRLLERQGESLNYCLVGAGDFIEPLQSLHDIPGFPGKFGLPGSGKRRCNDESDGPFGSSAVRSWANKELGESVVQHFSEPFSGNSFTLLVASRGVSGRTPWILLRSEEELTSCYFDRGDEMAFHENFTIKENLKSPKAELPPIR